MRFLALLFATVMATLALAASAAATKGVDVDVIAEGLDNPRHVAVSPFGDIYVAEAGTGGSPATSESCFDSAEGAGVHRRHGRGHAHLAPLVAQGPAAHRRGPGVVRASKRRQRHRPARDLRHGIRRVRDERWPDGPDPSTPPVTRGRPARPDAGSGGARVRALREAPRDPFSRPLQRGRRPLGVREREQPGRGSRQRACRQQSGRRPRAARRALRRRRCGRQHGPEGVAPRRGQRAEHLPEHPDAEPVRRRST